MKRKVYKRYRTGKKKGGQRYHVGRKKKVKKKSVFGNRRSRGRPTGKTLPTKNIEYINDILKQHKQGLITLNPAQKERWELEISDIKESRKTGPRKRERFVKEEVHLPELLLAAQITGAKELDKMYKERDKKNVLMLENLKKQSKEIGKAAFQAGQKSVLHPMTREDMKKVAKANAINWAMTPVLYNIDPHHKDELDLELEQELEL